MLPPLSAVLACIALLIGPGFAAAPEPAAITPELVTAARQEGSVVVYTSVDVQLGEKIGKAFEAAFPGIKVQIERNGAERIVQRLAQERGSNIHAADVVEASDMSALILWKREGWLAPFLPKEVADKWPADQRDRNGYYATDRFTLSPIAYNTRMIKPEEAPRSFADLLDPQWQGKIVKAHPAYSGTLMTVTFEISRELGWDYLQKLGRQHVLQVQSGAEPPKKVVQGERPIMADGTEYVVLQFKAVNGPIEPVYPSEGTPLVPAGAGVMIDAPHPNAARLFVLYLFSREGQQMMGDIGYLRSFHPEIAPPAGAKPLSAIKLMHPDPEAQDKATDAIKKKYAEYFGL